MTAIQQEPGAVQLPEVPLAKTHAQSAQRASVAPAPAMPQTGVTQRDRAQKWASGIASGPSLLHDRAPSMAGQHARHLQAAGHFDKRALRRLRLAWGYLHLGVKGLLHVIDWVTESPPRTLIAIAVWAAMHYWLLKPLPWF